MPRGLDGIDYAIRALARTEDLDSPGGRVVILDD